ncbi:MAG: hypothetical protein M0R30_06580 [Methanoregula sp.]|uniref:hypothetical protein n=1 Tax=Methanoregula sp. TaxID=2052170 RepID=UPI0025CE61F6|nr:hypothetical protein [Methanoregula sp.]MCK9631293.1 hypothetical protein [Methanoregula sp.]
MDIKPGWLVKMDNRSTVTPLFRMPGASRNDSANKVTVLYAGPVTSNEHEGGMSGAGRGGADDKQCVTVPD